MKLTEKTEYAQGRATELWLLALLAQNRWRVGDVSHGKASDIAILWPVLCHVEVKDESNYADSPHACIETFQGVPRRPSGIMTTRALVYVHIFGPRVLVYGVPPMKGYLRYATESRLLTEAAFAGADNSNGGVLVPRAMAALHDWACETPRGYAVGAIDAVLGRMGVREELQQQAEEAEQSA